MSKETNKTKFVSLNIREQRLKENCKCDGERSKCQCSSRNKVERNNHRDFLFGRITEQEYNKE